MPCLCVFFLKAENRVVDFFRTWHMSCLYIFWRNFMYYVFCPKDVWPTKISTWSVPSRDAAKMSYLNDSQEDIRDGRDYILRVTLTERIGNFFWIGWRAPIYGKGRWTHPIWREKQHFFCSNFCWWKTTNLEDMFVICVFFVGGSKEYVHYVYDLLVYFVASWISWCWISFMLNGSNSCLWVRSSS